MLAPSLATPHVELLSIGDELLLGDVVDTNASYLAKKLSMLSLRPAHFQTVGDEMADIIAAFKLALSRSQIVLVTGGLGPTDDDLTLEALAKVLGVKLEWREEVMDQMAERLKRSKESFSSSTRKQAWLPIGAHILKNDWGTAPGVRIDTAQGQQIFLTAGVPREMKGIFGAHVEPFLKERYPAREVHYIKHLHSIGVGESAIGERLKELMAPGCNPDVGTRLKNGACTVRVTSRASNMAAAEALAQPVIQRIRDALKDGMYGEDDIEVNDAVAHALLAKRLTLALAESCTAGLIAATLGEIPGISGTLLEGAVVYSDAAKMRTCGVKEETLQKFGAVSEQTARELAEGIRNRTGVDIALSVTGIAGPDGGTPEKPVGLVYFGIATAKGTIVREHKLLGGDRIMFRERALNLGLDAIRRAALEY